jgi:putative membrane protein
MMYWSGDWNAWTWLAMALSMLVFWSVVGLAIWLLVRPSTASAPTPEDVVRQRYAAGELDAGELAERLRTLQQHRPVSPSGRA